MYSERYVKVINKPIKIETNKEVGGRAFMAWWQNSMFTLLFLKITNEQHPQSISGAGRSFVK